MDTSKQQLRARIGTPRRSYPSPPSPMLATELEGLRQQVRVLQEQLNILLGRQGDILDQHVAFRDLIQLRIIRSNGEKA